MSDIGAQIKARIGYTEKPASSCKNCIHYRKVAHTNVDGMWDHLCHISPMIAVLHVSPEARCNKFKASQPEQDET